MLDVLEPLNLSAEVLDGIGAHSWRIEPPPRTAEGLVCRFADRIAYLTHDVEDAVRAGVISVSDLPEAATSTFGIPGRDWIDSMITAVIDESLRCGRIAMDPARVGADARTPLVHVRAGLSPPGVGTAAGRGGPPDQGSGRPLHRPSR